jgi:threonine synthase
VCLATAHPAKFPDAVERATGTRPALPARAAGLLEREEHYEVLPADRDAIADYIRENAAPETP